MTGRVSSPGRRQLVCVLTCLLTYPELVVSSFSSPFLHKTRGTGPDRRSRFLVSSSRVAQPIPCGQGTLVDDTGDNVYRQDERESERKNRDVKFNPTFRPIPVFLSPTTSFLEPPTREPNLESGPQGVGTLRPLPRAPRGGRRTRVRDYRYTLRSSSRLTHRHVPTTPRP